MTKLCQCFIMIKGTYCNFNVREDGFMDNVFQSAKLKKRNRQTHSKLRLYCKINVVSFVLISVINHIQSKNNGIRTPVT